MMQRLGYLLQTGASRQTPNRLGLGLVVVLVVVACDGAGPAKRTAGSVIDITLQQGSSLVSSITAGSTSTTAAPTTTVPAPLPLPDVDLTDPLVWFAPNMGSIDFPGLFSEPERWTTARERVDVLKFYGNNVSGFPFDIGGENVLSTFVDAMAFSRLNEWDIAIALELGAVKFFQCDPTPWAEFADLAIDNVESNGGRVSFVVMDEPLIGGQIVENGETCGYSVEKTAQVVASFAEAVVTAHPDVRIGDIVAYPHHTPPELEEWITAMGSAGFKPAFLHLDVDIERVRVEGSDVVSDLTRLRDFSEGQSIPFGVILTSNWTASGSDQSYYESAMQWTETVNGGLGRPTHAVFQSWWGPASSGLHEVPVNLPDNDPGTHSHTRLILEALDVLG
jgi:hypothetical protein